MMTLNAGGRPPAALAEGGAIPPGLPWIDLHDPTDAERAAVAAATGLEPPSRTALSEIENSARLAFADGVMTLSTPMVSRADHAVPVVAPLGFVLGADRLVTVRYAPSRAFDAFADRFRMPDGPHTATAAFAGLLEAMVDRLADVLEGVGAELDRASRTIFRPETTAGPGDRRTDASLHAVLQGLGRSGDLASSLRDSLLGLLRITGFVLESEAPWADHALLARLRTIRTDLQSLNDYGQQLANKVQFLLDATLGFINIQQNSIIKVLTVASIAGIPPTLIAGIYGMNFAVLPELKWAYGYPYSLALMAISAIVPVLWLKRRGWLA